MLRIPRNYISDIITLGGDIRSIAKELKVSQKQVKGWQLTKPPIAFYEPIRNIARRTNSKVLRQAGFPPKKASTMRRLASDKVQAEIGWINKIIDTLYNDWNFRYRAYMSNPAGWIAAHPNKKIPRETSRDEVKRRIGIGINRGKSKEEIENY